MRIGTLLVLLCLVLPVAGGCAKMGRAAGKTQAAVEKGVDDLKRGYDEGYSEKKEPEQKKTSGE